MAIRRPSRLDPALVVTASLVALLQAGCTREPRDSASEALGPDAPAQLAQARSAAPEPWNVLLVSIATLRPDHLGAYGYSAPTSPNIDAFVADAVLYEQAIAHSASTLTSHASLFTSLLPHRHRAFLWRKMSLRDASTTLTEVLRDQGFATAGFHGGAQLAPELGLAQGFDVFEEVKPPFSEAVARACRWLESEKHQPFFLFLHTYEVHHPYRPRPEHLDFFRGDYDGLLPDHIEIDEHLRRINAAGEKRLAIDADDLAHIVATYDALIRGMDEGFGALVACLERLDLYDDTLIVFTSDHGEELGEHGIVGWHGHSLHDELVRIPLVMKLPGSRFAGTRVERQVRSIDVAPTVLEVLGLPRAPSFQGDSLLDRPAAAPAPESAYAVSELDGMPNGERALSLRTERWKLYDGRLYDLRSDPSERRDVTSDHPDVANHLAFTLGTAIAEAPERSASQAKVEISDETRKRLEQLGYAH